MLSVLSDFLFVTITVGVFRFPRLLRNNEGIFPESDVMRSLIKAMHRSEYGHRFRISKQVVLLILPR